MIDGHGALWITDFGLARTTADNGLTMTGDVLGTLRYMSPEQALAKHGLVDHRTDVYSLGVTLYELMTGTPAVTGKDREEILNAITLDEPRAPRTRNAGIPRDLETIVLKTIAKEPAERYATARELADDLRNLLDEKPIRAKPPTLMQKTSKWLRRHRQLVRIAALFCVLALVGLGVSTILIWQGRQEAIRQANLVSEERDRAERSQELTAANLELAYRALDEMYLQVAEDELPRHRDSDRVDRQFLQKALKFYEEFAKRNQSEPEARKQAGMAYRRAGDISYRLGEHAKAHESYDKSIQLFEALAADFPDEPEFQFELAKNYNNLGASPLESGGLEDARKAFRTALEFREKLHARYPKSADYRFELAGTHNNLALLLQQTNHPKEVERAIGKALSLYQGVVRDSPNEPKYVLDAANTHSNLGQLLGEMRRYQEVEPAYEEALHCLAHIEG